MLNKNTRESIRKAFYVDGLTRNAIARSFKISHATVTAIIEEVEKNPNEKVREKAKELKEKREEKHMNALEQLESEQVDNIIGKYLNVLDQKKTLKMLAESTNGINTILRAIDVLSTNALRYKDSKRREQTGEVDNQDMDRLLEVILKKTQEMTGEDYKDLIDRESLDVQ